MSAERTIWGMNLFQRLFVPFHVLLYRVSGGRLLGRLGGLPVLLLTTTGRRTGKRRTLPLLYLEEEDCLVVAASAAGADRHPGWYVNLVANPDVEVQTLSALPQILGLQDRDHS